MIEQIKAVNNPLTIIAIFAGLAEIAGTVALATVDKSIQGTFVWFVMGFPILLVSAFFATLNFNPQVLYAPSDFKNEENFLRTVIGTQNVSMNLGQVMQQLEGAKQHILNMVGEQITAAGGQERKKLTEFVSAQLNGIESRLESVREEAKVVASAASVTSYPRSNLQARLLEVVSSIDSKWFTVGELSEAVTMRPSATLQALKRLEERGLVTSKIIDSNISYRLPLSRNENIDPIA